MGRRLNLTAGVVGLALLVGTPLLVGGAAEPVADVGEAPEARTTAAVDGQRPPPTPATPGRGDAGDEDPPVAVEPPATLAIPALGIRAEVVRVGLEDDGAMEVPEDVSTVGWYELGVAPGEPGTAVVAGHVDGRTQGRGAFFELARLDLDDEVVLSGEDGADVTWVVTGRRSYPKDELPVEELFVLGGAPRLALITCGGDFDRGERSYVDNVVVLLEPAG